jgi:flagellin-like hook-associated protein FlgL
VGINSLAKNVLTAELFADLRRLIEFADSIHISDENELRRRLESTTTMNAAEITSYIDLQLIEERAIANAALYTHFNNMLFLLDGHIDQITREHTQLGARAQRLDMLQHRLEADEVSYERLTSQNEDTDIARAIMLRVNAETAFQASLRANAGVMQLTLANFL